MDKLRDIREYLFICSQSSNPNSILLLDPLSGSSRWSFRGTELQSAKIHVAEILGKRQTHLCIALAEKSVIVFVPLNIDKKSLLKKIAFSTKSILNDIPNCLISHPTGDFLFVTSENKLFTWETHSGQLFSLVEQHLRKITAMAISSCGNFLSTASQDGAINIYMTQSLIAQRETELDLLEPIANHCAHTLSVNDIYITKSLNPRILSVSDDHTACLYSIATRQILLKITADQPLNACCMDPAECKLFVASNSGHIRAIDLQTEFSNRSLRMNDSLPDKERINQQFEHHKTGILKLCVNSDGTRLASGDKDGAYCIWDIGNGQCMRSGKMTDPISGLAFIQNCIATIGRPKNDAPDSNFSIPLLSSLQKSMPITRKLMVYKHSNSPTTTHDEKNLQFFFDQLLKCSNKEAVCGISDPEANMDRTNHITTNLSAPSTGKKRRLLTNGEEPEEILENGGETSNDGELKQRIAELERELSRVVQINMELYNFAASLAVDDDGNSGNTV